MKTSTDRILTTHVGSLPRPADLLAVVEAREQGKEVDANAHAARVRSAVGEVVRKQVELGIDVIDDGEFGKPSFVSYVNERLAGFEPDQQARQSSWSNSREARSFPEFYAAAVAASRQNRMVCTAPVSYRGKAQLQRDIDNLKAAVNGAARADEPGSGRVSTARSQHQPAKTGVLRALMSSDALCARTSEESPRWPLASLASAAPAEIFMPAISPASASDWQRNAYYKSDEEYLFAVAEAMREEYEAIVRAGFVLQIDDPQFVTQWIKEPDLTLAQYRKWAEGRVAALNHALRNIPPEKVRHHTCYGINMGPRIHDMEMKNIVDIVLTIRAGAYSFEAANPRHEHEWQVWETVQLPDGKSLIPGVISHSTVLVEHPELVAQRIARYAKVVGRENVIAGADCGFATFAGSKEVHPSIVWAKFQSLVEGARIASKQLWS